MICNYSWLKREGTIQKVLDGASTLLQDYVDMPGGIIIPPATTLELYYGEILIEARKVLFPLEVSLGNKNNDAEIQSIKRSDLYRMASQRLLFR